MLGLSNSIFSNWWEAKSYPVCQSACISTGDMVCVGSMQYTQGIASTSCLSCSVLYWQAWDCFPPSPCIAPSLPGVDPSSKRVSRALSVCHMNFPFLYFFPHPVVMIQRVVLNPAYIIKTSINNGPVVYAQEGNTCWYPCIQFIYKLKLFLLYLCLAMPRGLFSYLLWEEREVNLHIQCAELQ